MAKNFDITKMKRGKDLSDIASQLEDISEDTIEVIGMVTENPVKEMVTKAVVTINRDTRLSKTNKNILLVTLREQYAELFNFNNCPEDYEELKTEAKFLSELSQYSFLLLGQRLIKIRDNEYYKLDGYSDFKSFVIKEIKISQSTAYNYMDLITFFGVQALGLQGKTDPSKLISVLPLLKSNNEDIPKEKLKKHFIKESQNKSFREIQDETKQLKIQYGLSKEKAIESTDIDPSKNELNKYKLKVKQKLQYQIDLYNDYIKQLRRKKKELEYNRGQIMNCQVAISTFEELMKELKN